VVPEIVQAGAPVLRQRARRLTLAEIQSRETRKLIDEMRETMRSTPGVGLAAPQIARSVQIAVIEDRKEYLKEATAEHLAERERRPVPFHVIINPQISAVGDLRAEFFEGCLSLPGFTAVVNRAYRVRVDCLDHRGKAKQIEATGWYARILQHEIDHLNGTLYIDRMLVRTFCTLDNFGRHWKAMPVADAVAAVGETAPAV
jgi:peptide deformylase